MADLIHNGELRRGQALTKSTPKLFRLRMKMMLNIFRNTLNAMKLAKPVCVFALVTITQFAHTRNSCNVHMHLDL